MTEATRRVEHIDYVYVTPLPIGDNSLDDVNDFIDYFEKCLQQLFSEEKSVEDFELFNVQLVYDDMTEKWTFRFSCKYALDDKYLVKCNKE